MAQKQKSESKSTNNKNVIELTLDDNNSNDNNNNNNNLKEEFSKLLSEENIDNLIEMVQIYLKNFRKKNLNDFYNSIIFLLEWTYTHCRTFLNLVLCEIHNELKSIILPLKDVENSQQFFKLNFKFFDLSLKLYRCIAFNELREKISSFDSLINYSPDECGKYVIKLMIQAHPQDISAFLFNLLLSEIKNISDNSIISDALMIVFIKNDNSFRMISSFENEFTTKYRSIFEQFLNNLDSFLLDDRKFSEYYQLYQLSSYQRRTQKMIKRFLNRVFNNFDSLDPFSAPHYIETTNWETLAYLIKSRFRNKNISEDAFYELSYRLIEVSPEIEQRFRSCLRKQGREAEQKFDNLLPYSKSISQSYMQSRDLLLENIRNINQNKNDKDIPYYSQNYKFKCYIGKPNQDFSIYFVCDEEGLHDMITQFLPESKLIAIDAEWLPIFNYQKSSISIIQIAMKNICFIIDLNNFSNKSDRYKALWHEFVEKCFHSQQYLKIGFGIGQDLEMLRQSTSNRQIRFVNVLDLTKSSRNFIEFLAQQPMNSRNRYFKKIILRCKEATEASIDNNNDTEFNNETFNKNNLNNSKSPSSSSLQGLSLLTYVLFGFALDKSERQSDWTRRPLRSAQLLYAALDSYCLLDIYEKMQKIAIHFDFPDFQTFSMHIKSFNNDNSSV